MQGAIAQLVRQSAPGDVLFIHFSGHGTQVRIYSSSNSHPTSDWVQGLETCRHSCAYGQRFEGKEWLRGERLLEIAKMVSDEEVR